METFCHISEFKILIYNKSGVVSTNKKNLVGVNYNNVHYPVEEEKSSIIQNH